MKIRIAGLLILLLCLLVVCAAADDQLTLLIYMTGSDLESVAGAATADLQEMQAAMPAEGVHTLVLTGGASEWQSNIPADQNVLWQVTQEGLVQIESSEAQSMGSPEVLRDFLRRGVELFPADRYALIFWDHGGGPMMGVCFDERFQSDGLTLEELTSALKESPFAEKPLMFIGFDACLMAAAETAGAMVPYADYMIASQEPEPAEGWDYRFLSALPGAQDGLEAGKLIIDAFGNSQQDTFSLTTLSCLNLSAMDKLEKAADDVFRKLSGQVPESYKKMATSRINTKTLGASSPMEWDLVDLLDLAETLETDGLTEAAALREALKDVVVYQFANEPNVCGLSVYAPFDNKDKYTHPWAAQFETAAFSEGYREYVRAFTDEWMGTHRAYWRDAELMDTAEEALRQRISVELAPDELDDLAKARLLILQKIPNSLGETEYQFLYAVEDDNLFIHKNLETGYGILSGYYQSEALYLLDDQDELIGGPLVWRSMDSRAAAMGINESGGILTSCVLETAGGSELLNMYLTWYPDENGDYHMGDPYLLNHDLNIFSPSSRKLQQGDVAELGEYARRYPTEDRFYQDWDLGDMIAYNRITYNADAGWHVRFMPLQSSYERVAVFEMTDFQANPHLTKPIPLENVSVIDLLSKPLTQESDGLAMTIESAKIYAGADSCLKIGFSLSNKGNDTPAPDILNFRLNDTTLPEHGVFLSRETLYPGNTRTFELTLYADNIRNTGIDLLKHLGVCIGLYQDYYSLIDSVWFDFDLTGDLKIIASSAREASEPLLTGEQDGVHFTLFRTYTRTGWYSNDTLAEIQLENRSDEDLMISGIRFKPGDSKWFVAKVDYPIPKGCNTWVFPVSFNEEVELTEEQLREMIVCIDIRKTLTFGP